MDPEDTTIEGEGQEVIVHVPDADYVDNLVDYQAYDQASTPDMDDTVPLTEDDYN